MSAPADWLEAGSAPQDYDFSLDANERHSGTRSGRIRAIKDSPAGFGTLMQHFVPDDYRSKRVRLSGWIKTDAVEGWCGLWMRVDDAEKRALAFDNMQSRPIRGTTGWTRYEIVLDVATQSTLLAFGILLTGKGAAWLDNLAFEIVGEDVPTTGELRKNHPSNLNFED